MVIRDSHISYILRYECCSNKHSRKIRCLMPPGCALNHATKRCIKGSCLTTPPVHGCLKLEILQQHLVHLSAGLSEAGVPGVTWHPPILIDLLALSQPEGRLFPLITSTPLPFLHPPTVCFAALKRVLRQRFYLGYIKSTLFCGLRITSVVH